jgi:staphylococcal nuclease domain-containing protein 1
LSQSINHGPASPSKSQIGYLLRAQINVVLSGDTIVLVGKPRPDGKPPTERILSLAYVSAPRLKREGDEVHPFTVLT